MALGDEKSGVTMADVADALGISKITVSRALSGHATVKPATREKVKEAAERLGYRMNVAARNLRLQRTQAIAVVIELTPQHNRSMMEPYPLSLLGGIMEELTRANFNLVLTTVDLFHKSPPAVDGAILLGQGVHEDAVGLMKQAGLPFCVWGASHGDGHPVTVGSDNLQGGRLAAEHLLAQGCRRALFLGDIGHGEVEDRYSGFASVFEAGNGNIAAVLPCNFTMDDAYRAVRGFLDEQNGRIDAIFAASDSIAMGAIHAFSEAGHHIPDDMLIIGFDDSPGAALSDPELTSVRQDWEGGGRMLARKVLKLIDGQNVESQILPVDLIARESSLALKS